MKCYLSFCLIFQPRTIHWFFLQKKQKNMCILKCIVSLMWIKFCDNCHAHKAGNILCQKNHELQHWYSSVSGTHKRLCSMSIMAINMWIRLKKILNSVCERVKIFCEEEEMCQSNDVMLYLFVSRFAAPHGISFFFYFWWNIKLNPLV